MKLKPSKCSLCQRNVEFLGHVVSEDGIAMQDEKISAIRDWPPCRNVTKHGNADGLSRKPSDERTNDESEEETDAEVFVVRKDEACTTDLVGEDLRQRQRKDAEIGAIVNFRLASDEAPKNEENLNEVRI